MFVTTVKSVLALLMKSILVAPVTKHFHIYLLELLTDLFCYSTAVIFQMRYLGMTFLTFYIFIDITCSSN